MSNTENNNVTETNLIRSMVRGVYAVQQLRIQMGNRITGNFKAKLGFISDGMKETDLAKQDKKVLDMLRDSYKRITDGIVTEGAESVVESIFPKAKSFTGDSTISSYAELILVSQYMTLLKDEERQFKQLKTMLEDIPIYKEYLCNVAGIGEAMAGVIISEMDVYKATYPSSFVSYAGIDAVTVAKYKDSNGKEHIVPADKIAAIYANDPNDESLFVTENGYPITYENVGTSRKEFCLVDKEYVNKDGEIKMRKSITFNPFLKTKLIGVLGTSFLRANTGTVNGKKVGAVRRAEMAVKEFGYDGDVKDDFEVCNYLRSKGNTVVVEPSEFGKFYYDYKNRISNMAKHKNKTPKHIHNMAIRYMIKMFLINLHIVWSELAGLPKSTPYSEAKLGIVHGARK
jgi:hypothetical protein